LSKNNLFVEFCSNNPAFHPSEGRRVKILKIDTLSIYFVCVGQHWIHNTKKKILYHIFNLMSPFFGSNLMRLKVNGELILYYSIHIKRKLNILVNCYIFYQKVTKIVDFGFGHTILASLLWIYPQCNPYKNSDLLLGMTNSYNIQNNNGKNQK